MTYAASQPTSFQNVTHHHHHPNTNPFHHASLTNHHDIRIPHVLIFTYRRNLLEMPTYLSEGELDDQMRHVQELIRQAEILKQGAAAAAKAAAVGPNDPLRRPPPYQPPRSPDTLAQMRFQHDQQFLLNVRWTIQMYVTAWQQLSTTTSTSPNTTTTTTKPRIWFLEDTDCACVIRRVEPKLVPFFETEPMGKYRGDVCCAVALYLSGGYYFDVDMKAIQPYVPSSPAITFDTAMTESQESHFNSIMVAAPRHPILYWSLQIMLQLYQQEQGAKPGAAKKEDSILNNNNKKMNNNHNAMNPQETTR
ncbi:hypothetical protein ACA910_001743 [Epithemia clementina (nom. ined.)]